MSHVHQPLHWSDGAADAGPAEAAAAPWSQHGSTCCDPTALFAALFASLFAALLAAIFPGTGRAVSWACVAAHDPSKPRPGMLGSLPAPQAPAGVVLVAQQRRSS